MGKPLHAVGKLRHDGAVDADGHILEPPDLWERYLEPKHRDRALRFYFTNRRPAESGAPGGREFYLCSHDV